MLRRTKERVILREQADVLDDDIDADAADNDNGDLDEWWSKSAAPDPTSVPVDSEAA